MAMLGIFLLFALIQTIQGGEVDGSQCIAEAMPSMDASGRTRPHLKANKRNGLMLVFNNYTFDCSGILKQWSLQIQYSGDRHCEFNFDLHILRPTDRDDYCGLVSVGSDRTTLTIGERRVRNKRYSMSVNTTNDVIIKEGDVMGLVIYMEECERQMEVKLMEEKEMKRKSASSRVVHSTRKVSSKFTPTDGLDIEGVAGFSCGRDSNNDGDSESSSESSRRSTKSSRGRSSTTSSASRQRSSSTPINSNIRRRDRRRRQQDNPAPFKLHAGAPLINAIIEPNVLASEQVKENMEKIENREEVGSGSGANTGEHQSEGGVNGGAVSAAIIVTVGGLLAISVGIVATIWLFYRARQRETGTEGEFNIRENSAYGKSDVSSTPAEQGISKNTTESGGGRKPTSKLYPMKVNTAYSVTTTTSAAAATSAPRSLPQNFTPHTPEEDRYLTPPPSSAAGEEYKKEEEEEQEYQNNHVLVVDGNIYEVPVVLES